jgi:hypothetical protein
MAVGRVYTARRNGIGQGAIPALTAPRAGMLQHLDVARDGRRRAFVTDLLGDDFTRGFGVLIVAAIQTGRVHQARSSGRSKQYFGISLPQAEAARRSLRRNRRHALRCGRGGKGRHRDHRVLCGGFTEASLREAGCAEYIPGRPRCSPDSKKSLLAG